MIGEGGSRTSSFLYLKQKISKNREYSSLIRDHLFPSHEPVVKISEFEDDDTEDVGDNDMDEARVVSSAGSEYEPEDVFGLV